MEEKRTDLLRRIVENEIPDYLAAGLDDSPFRGFGVGGGLTSVEGRLSAVFASMEQLMQEDESTAGHLLYLLDQARKVLIDLGANPLYAVGMANPYASEGD